MQQCISISSKLFHHDVRGVYSSHEILFIVGIPLLEFCTVVASLLKGIDEKGVFKMHGGYFQDR
jgi:hypothetical protein